MPVEIDIRTRIVDNNHVVLIARPGGKYRLHTEFYERNFVGIELPGLFEANEVISYNDEKLVARIKRAIEIRKWFLSGQNEPQPDFNIDNYDNKTINEHVQRDIGSPQP